MCTSRWITVIAAFAITPSLSAAPLLTNGGFETGDFSGWTVTNLPGGSGSWFPESGSETPLSNNPTVGPAAGGFYAVTDQTGAGTHVLTQSFTVPIGATSVSLAFDMFVNDWSGQGPIIDPIGLDHRGPSNQHARVDLLVAGASPFDTNFGVISNFFLGVGPDNNPNAYTPYLFDITQLVTPGNSYKIRFGEVDNLGFLNQGIDNVDIQAKFGSVPEPSSLALLGFGLAGIAAHRRKAQSLV